MSPVWTAFVCGGVVFTSLTLAIVYLVGPIRDAFADRRERRDRAKRVRELSSRELVKLARMRQEIADAAAQRAKRGRK